LKKIIDSHVHLDLYKEDELAQIMGNLEKSGCAGLISVSFHLDSCKRNLALSQTFPEVHPAFGFHPEQPLPSDEQLADLFSWMERHADAMAAVGEVGLPYYLRAEQGSGFQLGGYIELLEELIKRAKKWDIPIILHAVYDDAPVACDLLEKHCAEKAHFHWFKGDRKTAERMAANGYFISVAPDVAYEEEIRELARFYPLEQMMAETDGPWRFEGRFSGRMTHPGMIHDAITELAGIKKMDPLLVYEALYGNTAEFYRLSLPHV
jgi:TatD DNase family protein